MKSLCPLPTKCLYMHVRFGYIWRRKWDNEAEYSRNRHLPVNNNDRVHVGSSVIIIEKFWFITTIFSSKILAKYHYFFNRFRECPYAHSQGTHPEYLWNSYRLSSNNHAMSCIESRSGKSSCLSIHAMCCQGSLRITVHLARRSCARVWSGVVYAFLWFCHRCRTNIFRLWICLF